MGAWVTKVGPEVKHRVLPLAKVALEADIGSFVWPDGKRLAKSLSGSSHSIMGA
jgi:hypothetical protein